MLEELTAYKTFGSAIHLTEMARVIATAPCTVADLFVIADSNNSVEIPRIKAAIALLKELGLCSIEEDVISGNTNLESIVKSPQSSGIEIGQMLLQRMLDEGLISVERIKFDLDVGCGYLQQNDIALRYSQMRNYLIDSGVLFVEEDRLLFNQISAEILESKVVTLEGGMSPEELTEK